MDELTPQQRKRVEKLARVAEKGDVGIFEHLIEIEDEFDEKVTEIKSEFKDAVLEVKQSIPNVVELLKNAKGKDGENGKPGQNGEPGKDYILTEKDKKEIAQKVNVPVVEKVIEKTEVIKEQPIEVVKEVAVFDEKMMEESVPKMGEAIRDSLELLPNGEDGGEDERLDKKAIKGIDEIEKKVEKLEKRPIGSIGGMSGVKEIIAGTNITVDNTRLGYPTISATGGSGAVDSVNGQTGVVVLDADDISDTATTNKFVTATDVTKLGNLSGTNTGDQDLSGLVPYTGATTDVDLGSNSLTVNNIFSSGEMYMTASDGATNVQGSGISVSAGFGNGSGDGGSLLYQAGSANDSGGGGQVAFVAGDGGPTASGFIEKGGGYVAFASGNAQGGNFNGGDIFFETGHGNGTGTSGKIKFSNSPLRNYGNLDFANLTSEQTFSYPDATGTVALVKPASIVGVIEDAGGIASDSTSAVFKIPFAGTITGYSIAVDTGTCTIKTWKKATGTAIPTISDSISTSGVSLSSGTYIASSTLTDFTTTTVSAGDLFIFHVSAVSGATKITFQLDVTP